jgi:hypothetical protein
MTSREAGLPPEPKREAFLSDLAVKRNVAVSTQIRKEIKLSKLMLNGSQVRFSPLSVRPSLPNRHRGDLEDGDSNQVRDQHRLGADGCGQPEEQPDIFERGLPRAGRQSGLRVQRQVMRRRLHAGRETIRNGCRKDSRACSLSGQSREQVV